MVVKFQNRFDPCRCRLVELCSHCHRAAALRKHNRSANLEAIANPQSI